MFYRLLRKFVSPTDQLLATFDQEHTELSPSQTKECEKHKAIRLKRDYIQPKKTSEVWEDF